MPFNQYFCIDWKALRVLLRSDAASSSTRLGSRRRASESELYRQHNALSQARGNFRRSVDLMRCASAGLLGRKARPTTEKTSDRSAAQRASEA